MKKTSFFRRVFSSRILPSWTILLFDACVIVFSMILAYAIRFTVDDAMAMGTEIRISTAVVLVLNLIFFRVFRTYSNIIRYSSFVDVMHIFVALTLGYFSSAAVSWLWPLAFKSSIAPTSVLMISYVISFAIMVISRMAIKTLNDYFNQTETSYYRTYIYGTKAGVDIAKSLRTETENKFHIMGFVADNPDMVGKVLMGVNVYANDDTLMDKIRRDRVDAFVVSPLKADVLKESDIADRLLKEKVQIFLAPDVSNDWDGSAKRRGIKEVQIEDLLGRDPIKINMKEIAAHLEGKRVLITGAAGSIGSEIMRQVAMFNPYQMILIDEAETPLHDIRLELKNK